MSDASLAHFVETRTCGKEVRLPWAMFFNDCSALSPKRFSKGEFGAKPCDVFVRKGGFDWIMCEVISDVSDDIEVLQEWHRYQVH